MSDRNICITVFVRKRDVNKTVKRIEKMELPPTVRIILYMPLASRDIPGVFPVNKLRNIAIVNIVTTHFLVLDMDMWPSRDCSCHSSGLDNLYKELVHLPPRLLDSKRTAIIVPAFFLTRNEILSNCSTVLSCAKLCWSACVIKSRSNNTFPRNKNELVDCLRKEKCFSKKQKALTHVQMRRVIDHRCT